jgi:translation elongation factor EF-G
MSILKKVLRAVQKMFKASVRRPKKRRSKATKPRKQRKPVTRRVVSKSKPKAPQLKPVKATKVSKAPVPKPAVKAKAVPAAPKVKSVGILVGEVTHYFDRIKVCVIRIDRDQIKKGDRLLIKGPKSELIQNVTSMQIENEDVNQAKKGQLIGLKVAKAVVVKDEVYKTSSKG